MITREEVRSALPASLRSAATQELADKINQISSDPLLAENIRNNFIGYSAVLKQGKFKTEEYLNAVVYVSYKLMGFNNQESYLRTFPDRHQKFLEKQVSQKDISAYVAAYHRGKLVNLIMEQSLVPTWVLNQDIHQRAINHLAQLMIQATSEKVQCEAATALLTHLKKPEVKDINLKVDIEENAGMTELKQTLAAMAAKQINLIEGGVTTKEIAGASIYTEAEYTDVEPGDQEGTG